MTENEVNVRNVLVLLGIIITTAGLIYFATEFVDLISEWGRFASLGLLTVMFVALGVHFDETGHDALIGHRGWRWLKVTNALYVLGAIGALATTIAFFAIDDLDRLWKVLAAILGGLALILLAARGWERRHPKSDDV